MAGKRTERRRGISHPFSKVIVGYCILIMSALIICAMWIAYKTGTIVDGILHVALGFFGGELMLICMRDIFKKNKEETTDD